MLGENCVENRKKKGEGEGRFVVGGKNWSGKKAVKLLAECQESYLETPALLGLSFRFF